MGTNLVAWRPPGDVTRRTPCASGDLLVWDVYADSGWERRGGVPGEMPQVRKRSSSSSRLSGARDRAIEARHAVPAARLPETAARDGGSFQARFYFCPVTAN